MDLSLSLAKVFGLWMVLSGLGMFGNAKWYRAVLDDFVKSPALTLVTGAALMFLGFFLVLKHNVWQGGWHVLITLFAWATLLKGAAYLLFPQTMQDLTRKLNTPALFMWGGLISLALGAYLLFIGFGA